MLTVACVMVHGSEAKRRYGPEYVEKLHSMVRRNLDRPFRMVCLTNKPGLVPSCAEPIKIPYPKGDLKRPLRGWWAKPRIFDPELPIEGRVLYLDLDVLVVGRLEPIVDFPADFALVPDMAPTFQGRFPHKVVKGYNSSVVVFDARARPQLWQKWKPRVAKRLWGDQDWIGEQCPGEQTFPKDWFTRITPSGPPWHEDCKVVLCIKWKNKVAEEKWPWVAEWWR